MTNTNENATKAQFSVVIKTDTGYRVACGFGFETIAEADAWRKVNLKNTETRISKRLPGLVGFGFTNLNADDLVD